MNLDPALRRMLVCPVDHAPLEDAAATSELVCSACGNRYPVRDGIPVMLADQKGEAS